jgi:hypothetical protein
MSKELVSKLLELHKQGSLHPLDGGMICVGCGGQWPCQSVRIINRWALSAVLRGEND